MGARLRRAERVIVISAHTGKDIVEHLGVDPGKIRVIHLGVASDFHPIPEEKRLGALRSRYRLPERCLLYVGNTMPHKNISRLVSAMALVRKRFPAVPLVIAGSSDKYRPMVAQTIEDKSLSNEVRFLGHVPEEDLPTLYNCASAFLFPSLYEGFGMPVLEAMACGTPVVTSGAASIPEIVGDAAITVDPYDVKSIADGIVHLLENRSEAEKLSRVGIQRAKEFTWRKCAEKHLMVYDEVLKGK
jgi:glycosyltransferase involved in cell wall biosynthesis